MAQNDNFERESPAGDHAFIRLREQLIKELSLSRAQIALAQDTALLAVSVAVALGWNSDQADELALDAFRFVVGSSILSPGPVQNVGRACHRRCEDPYGPIWSDERIAAELPTVELQAAFRQVQLVWQPVGTA